MKKNLFFVLAFCIFFVGCSDSKLKTNPVEGDVTLDGTPLPNASISFYPKDEAVGKAGYATTDDKGHYKLSTQLGEPDQGTVPGEYKVVISSSVQVPTKQMRRTEDGSEAPIMNVKETLPEKYSSPSMSQLTATVEAKKNKIDFPLTTK